jgi:hypothetical protein
LTGHINSTEPFKYSSTGLIPESIFDIRHKKAILCKKFYSDLEVKSLRNFPDVMLSEQTNYPDNEPDDSHHHFCCVFYCNCICRFRLSELADRLADLTGIGEALWVPYSWDVITSLSGIVTSVSAAYQNHPELAVSNAVGGIAFQTVFLAIADMFYRKANLEHASASLINLLQSIMLILLLALIMMWLLCRNSTLFNIHPGPSCCSFLPFDPAHDLQGKKGSHVGSGRYRRNKS